MPPSVENLEVLVRAAAEAAATYRFGRRPPRPAPVRARLHAAHRTTAAPAPWRAGACRADTAADTRVKPSVAQATTHILPRTPTEKHEGAVLERRFQYYTARRCVAVLALCESGPQRPSVRKAQSGHSPCLASRSRDARIRARLCARRAARPGELRRSPHGRGPACGPQHLRTWGSPT